MKKIKLPDKKEIELRILKGQIEQEKESFNRYVKVLAKHTITDIGTCSATVYFDELFHNALRQSIEFIEKANISKKEKSRLNHLVLFPAGIGGGSEKENLEASLAYWKRLVQWAKYDIDGLSEEKKIEIVRKGLEAKDLWSSQFDINSKVYKEIERLTKKR